MPEPTMKQLKEGDTCFHCQEKIEKFGKYGLSCGCDSVTIGRAEDRNREIQIKKLKEALRVAEEALSFYSKGFVKNSKDSQIRSMENSYGPMISQFDLSKVKDEYYFRDKQDGGNAATEALSKIKPVLDLIKEEG